MYNFATSIKQTAFSELIKKNWSVELFWFPFNSLMTWLKKALPTASAMQINTPQYPVPAEDVDVGKPVSYPYRIYVVLPKVITRVQAYIRMNCSPQA